jgi:hypothetical protein
MSSSELISVSDLITRLNRLERELAVAKFKADSVVSVREEESLKSLCLTSAQNFSGHGIPNLFAAKSKLAGLVWFIFLAVNVAFCCLYITNSFVDFQAHDVISSIRIRIKKEMNFPAFIACGWFTRLPIDQSVFHCTFNNQDCQLFGGLTPVLVVGKGTSTPHYCLRFNGRRTGDDAPVAAVNKIGKDFGLSISFLLPNDVLLSIYRLN